MTTLALPLTQPRPRRPWARDFALIGGLTGFLAPFATIHELAYSALTGLGGALGGGLLGLFSAWLLTGEARRGTKVALIPLGLVMGCLWGLGAALPTVVLGTDVLLISLILAGFAGALQLAWLWPLYWHRRVNGRSIWGLVVFSSLLAASLGWLGVLVLVRVY